MYEPSELMSIIYNSIGGTQRYIGGKEQIIPDACPYCGRSNERDFHASYGQIFPDGGWGFKCFANCETVSLYSLAVHVGGIEGAQVRDRALLKPRPKRKAPAKRKRLHDWQLNWPRYFSRFINHPGKYEAWDEYRHMPADIVEKRGLGMGVVPSSRCPHERLIVPILQDGKMVMIRGRSIDCDCPKWLPAAGVSPSEIILPFVNEVEPGDVVFVVESPVDAILINDRTEFKAVSALSTAYLYPDWVQQLKDRKPSLVIAAFDGDIAGNGFNQDELKRAVRKRVGRKLKADPGDITVTGVEMTRRGWDVSWDNCTTSGVERITIPAGVKWAQALNKAGLDHAIMKWDEPGQDIGKVWENQYV